MTTRNAIRPTRATKLKGVRTLRRKLRKNLRQSNDRGKSRGSVGAFSSPKYFEFRTETLESELSDKYTMRYEKSPWHGPI